MACSCQALYQFTERMLSYLCFILFVLYIHEIAMIFYVRELIHNTSFSYRRYSPLFILLLFLLNSCASLPPNSDMPPTFAFTDTDNTRFGRAYGRLKNDHPVDSGFHLLENGLDAFTARLILIQGADTSIDAQYYMIHNDLTGILFLNQLVQAANRGVRVRLLIDDMDLEGRDDGLSILAVHPNIDLRVFNPFSRDISRVVQYISGFGTVTRRMHNKSITVDNQISVVGGRNIGDEYFNANSYLVFGDLDVMAIGHVVKEVSKSFDEYWNSNKAYPINILRPDLVGKNSLEAGRKMFTQHLSRESLADYQKSLLDSNFAKKIKEHEVFFEWGKGHVLSDDPRKLASYDTTKKYSLSRQFKPYFKELNKELLIFSPYFIPGKTGTKYLADLSRNGVRVRIITNSLASTDVGLVHAGYSKYRRTLLRAGVELYEINSTMSKEDRNISGKINGGPKLSLHAKSFVLDSKKVFIGSLNLDPRSITENTEIGIMVSSEELSNRLSDLFNMVVNTKTFRLELTTDDDGLEFIYWHGWRDGKKHTWNFDPFTGFFRRFFIGLMGFLPIESQL
jgi:putative cardiolipin synthase